MKNPSPRSTNSRAFSLIELLVVIAIIGVLAAFSYGPIMSTIKGAKIEEGNKMANDIVFAIEQFEQTYDYLPYATKSIGLRDDSESDNPESSVQGDLIIYRGPHLAELLKVLMGKESTPDINPQNTQFFTAKTASNGVNGLEFEANGESPADLLDPWGNSFTVIIDYSGDNIIDLAGTNFQGHTDKQGSPRKIRQVAIAGSPGPDKEFYVDGQDAPEDDVSSF